MNVDHFFAIGAPHARQGKPCEDYALSGGLGDAVFGVVADGCSGAAASTEVGAQALCFAFERVLAMRSGGGAAIEAACANAAALAEAVATEAAARRISTNDADYVATVVGFAADGRQAHAWLSGDGAIAVRHADGSCRLAEIEWTNNSPYYLAYRWRPQWRQAFGGGTDNAAPAAQLTTTRFRAVAEGIQIIERTAQPLVAEAMADGLTLRFAPANDEIVSLAVFTDGLTRFGAFSTVEAATELLAFKNRRGDFVKRRCLRALRGLESAGLALGDDFAMACASFGDD